MFNWIGLYLVCEIIYGRGSGAMYDGNNTRTWKVAEVSPGSVIPSAGLSELFHTTSNTHRDLPRRRRGHHRLDRS